MELEVGKIGFRGPPVHVPVAFDTGERTPDGYAVSATDASAV
ncbi:hypothetical protein ACVWWN_002129 [Mycobacterium sp. URHB0021]|jgi:hypothetical protein